MFCGHTVVLCGLLLSLAVGGWLGLMVFGDLVCGGLRLRDFDCDCWVAGFVCL